jgi:hypothetical protein
MESVLVEAETRKVRATWTREMSKDLEVLYDSSVLGQLESKLAMELENEFRREVRKRKIEKILNS